MNSVKSVEMHSARTAAWCIAVLFIGQMLWAQETKETVRVGEVDRSFMVRLPNEYDSQRHYPVVILLHGMNQDADDMERLTQFDRLADKDSIIAVYPLALHGGWNIGVQPQEQPSIGMEPGRHRHYGGGGYPGGKYPGGGHPGAGQQPPSSRQPEEERRPAPADDMGFFNHMLDDLGAKFSVDASRIYVAGLSEGGLMSLRLGCALSDRIAAVAVVGAAMPKTMICLPSRPVAILIVDGTSDPIVPYNGGTEHNLNLPVISAEESAKAWARIDRCNEKPEKDKISAKEKSGMETKVDTYNSCQRAVRVVLYSLKGGGNTWPGDEQFEVEKMVGKTSQDLSANETIWSFLVKQRLPGQHEEAR
ncbi:MAG TPA: hypothetical protein VMS18_30625 [Candidatus Binatia bacterium]|nr:hypothetical protein [Candidatus Binatia bacterium]